MVLRMLSLISIIAFELCVAEELTLPVNTCHQDAADYSTCLKDATQEAWPRIAQGLPELNFPSMDPMFYENHHAIYDAGEIRADIEVTNITMIGLKDIRFTAVKAHFLDKDVFRLEVDFLMPKAFSWGTIKTIGSVGPFRLNSTEKLIDDFVNEYWPILYRAMASTIIDTWEPWCIDKANRLFSKVSFSKVFPK
ncbi:hypothetical protein DMN91_000205 [Ooceraea biroi]|uniref:Circadian clock-controlled protein n=1 Tax=Ooceraea biroi TaxID=2015173 RepID=A0A3L8E102_OOCBI|nr:hypothetical protein DMN91_000205 [Ooceraea biroi]